MAGLIDLDMDDFKQSMKKLVERFVDAKVAAVADTRWIQSQSPGEGKTARLGESATSSAARRSPDDDTVLSTHRAFNSLCKECQAEILDDVADNVSSAVSSFLADFRRKRNTLSVLENVTDEILTKIFALAILEEKNKWKFVLSHVNRRWRRLIFDDSRLWTTIDFQDPKNIVDECLVRVGEAPIDLRYQWMYDAMEFRPEVQHVFAERRHQIRSFITNLPTEQLGLASTFLSEALPLARAICVQSIPDGWSSVPIAPGPAIPDLFASNAPCLTFLTLERVGLPWNLHCFPHLTSLILDKCYFTLPTMGNDFLAILGALPALRQLSLIDVQNLCDRGSTLVSPPIHLPELQIMRLDSVRPHDAVRLLGSISTPRTMRLSGKVRFEEGDALSPFTGLHLEQIESLATLRDLSVDIAHVQFDVLESVTLTGAPVKAGANKNLQLALSGAGRVWGTHAFPHLCNPLSFAFAGLKRLALNYRQSGWGISTEDVPRHDMLGDLVYFLELCPELENLHLYGWLNPDVFEFLAADERRTLTFVPCPKVQVLHMECSSLDDEGLRNLYLRRTSCLPLRTLGLKGSFGFSGETVSWLRERIDEVFWDGEMNEVTTFEPMPSSMI